MSYFFWNPEKNEELIKERGISFERVIQYIENEQVLDVIKHPDTSKYPNQQMFILEIDNYAYLVPFVENDSEFFLKTIIPSRKATRKYLEVKS
ncbi:MAG: BrnT family toxin [Gammaproteobacteria bacterium]|nr:BrnT family toxin [Gammaproteobacteria bacterium]